MRLGTHDSYRIKKVEEGIIDDKGIGFGVIEDLGVLSWRMSRVEGDIGQARPWDGKQARSTFNGVVQQHGHLGSFGQPESKKTVTQAVNAGIHLGKGETGLLENDGGVIFVAGKGPHKQQTGFHFS